MPITRVTAEWTGFSGAPGYTNFFFDAFGVGDQVDLEVARVRAFFNSLSPWLPQQVDIQVQQETAIIDEATGELLGYQQSTELPEVVDGAGTGEYAAPAGAVVNWSTNAIARGRRLRGRTFIVPLSGLALQSDGTLSPTALTQIRDAAENLIGDGTGPSLVVWSRPRNGVGGTVGAVTGARVPDMVAILRSRRD